MDQRNVFRCEIPGMRKMNFSVTDERITEKARIADALKLDKFGLKREKIRGKNEKKKEAPQIQGLNHAQLHCAEKLEK